MKPLPALTLCLTQAMVLSAGLALAAASAAANPVTVAGSGSSLGAIRQLAEAFSTRNPHIPIKVLPSAGGRGGLRALQAGAAQIAVMARDLTDAETRAGVKAVEVARTPFVFVTPISNPALNLSHRSLPDIFSGKQTNWPDGSRLRLVLRPTSQSDARILADMNPAMRDALQLADKRRGMVTAFTDQELAEAVEATPGGLGATTLSSLLTEGRAIKLLSIDGIQPDPKSLASGHYRWYKPVYLATGSATSTDALSFMAFVRSPAGRQVLEATGHWVP